MMVKGPVLKDTGEIPGSITGGMGQLHHHYKEITVQDDLVDIPGIFIYVLLENKE